MGPSVGATSVMSRLTRMVAVLLTAVLVLSVTTPTVLASSPPTISVDQGDTTYTVTVTHNGSPANGSLVNVTDTEPNATYAVSGTTDENGTVTFDLPANETNMTITATVDNFTASISTTLAAANDSDTWDGSGPFGQWVVSWLLDMLSPGDNRLLGATVSERVVANNPGAEHRSDRADPVNATGPPEHALNKSANAGNATGPPEHAGNASTTGGNSANNGNGGNSSNSGNGNQNLARAGES